MDAEEEEEEEEVEEEVEEREGEEEREEEGRDGDMGGLACRREGEEGGGCGGGDVWPADGWSDEDGG